MWRNICGKGGWERGVSGRGEGGGKRAIVRGREGVTENGSFVVVVVFVV